MQMKIGAVLVDLEAHDIQRGGRPVRLSPKAFELLSVLIEQHPKAVSRRVLQDRLWPDTFVVEKNLTNLIVEIRGALDDSDGPSLVRTIHRFGYAFQEPPRPAATGASPPPEPLACRVTWHGGWRTLHAGEHVVGRDPSAAICLDDPSVSRRHAVIRIDAEGALLHDLGSKNGTTLGNGQLHGPARLVDGDCVRIGSVLLVVRFANPAESTRTLDARSLAEDGDDAR